MRRASVVTAVAQVVSARVVAAAIRLRVASAATAATADYFGERAAPVARAATVRSAQARVDAVEMVVRGEVSPATAALAAPAAKAE
jgi:uncharacterized protein YdeI (BOF family)